LVAAAPESIGQLAREDKLTALSIKSVWLCLGMKKGT
jgi:hypothetical protein